MKHAKYIAILFLMFVPRIGLAQALPAPWLTQSERAKFETLRLAGSEALFNLDYDAARKDFKEMAVAFPN